MDAPVYSFDPRVFIPRENIETTYNIQLPKFYDSKVEEILYRLFDNVKSNKSVSTPSSPKEGQDQGMGFTAALLNFFTPRSPLINIDLSQRNKTNRPQTKTDRQQKQDEKKKKEESEQRQATLIGVIAAFLFSGASYLAGEESSELKHLEFMDENRKELEEFVNSSTIQLQSANVSRSSLCIAEDKYKILDNQINCLNSIISKQLSVGDALKKYANRAFKVKAFIAVSALFTAVSALFKAKPMMKLGGISLVCSLGVLLYTHGEKSNDHVLEHNKQSLKDNIRTILNLFQILPKVPLNQPLHFDKNLEPPYFQSADFTCFQPVPQQPKQNYTPSAPPVYN